MKTKHGNLTTAVLREAITKIANEHFSKNPIKHPITFICNFKMWQEIQWEIALGLNERNPGYKYYYKYHQKAKIHEFRFYKKYKQNVEFREYYNESYEKIK